MTTEYTGYKQLLKDAEKERDAALAECKKLRALLLEFRRGTQFESNGQMYTLSGIPRELSRRVDAALKESK
jgi:hypothetical protein